MTDDSELQSQVAASFPLLPVPLRNDLIAEAPCDPERSEIRDAFAGRAWQILPLDTLRYHAEALFFFTPRVWVYYVLAYMNASIRHYEESDMVLTMIVASLFEFRDRLPLLMSQAQQVTMKAFLSWLATWHPDHPKRDAIDRLIGLFDQLLLSKIALLKVARMTFAVA